MSMYRSGRAFTPVISTAPAFASSAFATTHHEYALESTALGRVWQGPSGRAIRLSEISGGDYSIKVGTSDAVAASSDSILCLGGVVEEFGVPPDATHISVVSSTTITLNITLGTGQ